jgi:hypothetical protein
MITHVVAFYLLPRPHPKAVRAFAGEIELVASALSATRKQSPTYDLERQLGCEPDQLQLKGQH